MYLNQILSMDDQLVSAVVTPDALVGVVKGSVATVASPAVTLGALLASHHHQHHQPIKMLLFCSKS